MNDKTPIHTNIEAGEALLKYRRVKLSAGTAVYADAGEDILGVVDGNFGSGSTALIKLPNDSGTFLLEAADTFSAGAALYGAADGKVSDTVSGNKQFIALEAATAAGQYIECVPTTSADALSMQTKISDPAAMAEQTQDDLTDNGGGTADGTVASMAAPTTLTDSSGYDGTHDDTIAATTVPADLTENSGAIGGTNDGDLPALVDPAGDSGASVIAGIRENAAKVNEILALEAVLAQNGSDLAQKIIEIITLAGVIQNNIKEVTTQLGKVKVDVAAAKTAVDANNAAIDLVIDALEANGISATS